VAEGLGVGGGEGDTLGSDEGVVGAGEVGLGAGVLPDEHPTKATKISATIIARNSLPG
jgi:hypothetical protein